MKKQWAKRKRGDDDGSGKSIDRLTELPQPILHRILSLVSQKDAVRTGLLSQEWRYLWHGRPNVEFSERCLKREIWQFLDKTLQRLNQIKSTDKVLCKHLQKLCLHFVGVEEETFEKIMSSCPLIENLDLKGRDELRTIELRNAHNLKHFECSYKDEKNIKIKSPCVLESIRILCCYNWFLQHNNKFFPHLKCLYLHWVELSEESFDSFSANFPCLNELTLDLCHGFEDFRLTSCSIKRLTIKLTREHKIKALIDTPNILYFECSGSQYGILPSIKFTTTTKECKSHISVGYRLQPSDKNDATTWFCELNELLKGLSQSHISLDFYHQRCKNIEDSLHIKDSYGGFFKPVVVDTLRLSGYFLSSSVPSILNCLFWISRPRYILMNQYTSKARAKYKKETNRLAEFICKLIPKEIAETGHCYFWLQDLEEVSIEVWDIKAQEWLCVQGKSLPALPKKQEEQQIRFRLKWIDQVLAESLFGDRRSDLVCSVKSQSY